MENLAAGSEEPSGTAGGFSLWAGQPVGQQRGESSNADVQKKRAKKKKSSPVELKSCCMHKWHEEVEECHRDNASDPKVGRIWAPDSKERSPLNLNCFY